MIDLGAFLKTVPGNATCSIVYYGNVLLANKAGVTAACNSCLATAEECMLLLAMGMQETTLLTSAQRDASKDAYAMADGMANVSLWNLAFDLVTGLCFGGSPWLLNLDPRSAACILVDGIRRWGIPNILNFVRGGRTGVQDGVSYGAWEYRNTIATIVRALRNDTSLLTDGRRVECFLRGV
jgi:hypothetical protein